MTQTAKKFSLVHATCNHEMHSRTIMSRKLLGGVQKGRSFKLEKVTYWNYSLGPQGHSPPHLRTANSKANVVRFRTTYYVDIHLTFCFRINDKWKTPILNKTLNYVLCLAEFSIRYENKIHLALNEVASTHGTFVWILKSAPGENSLVTALALVSDVTSVVSHLWAGPNYSDPGLLLHIQVQNISVQSTQDIAFYIKSFWRASASVIWDSISDWFQCTQSNTSIALPPEQNKRRKWHLSSPQQLSLTYLIGSVNGLPRSYKVEMDY